MRRLRTQYRVKRPCKRLQTQHIRSRSIEDKEDRDIDPKLLSKFFHRQFRVRIIPIGRRGTVISASYRLQHFGVNRRIVVTGKTPARLHIRRQFSRSGNCSELSALTRNQYFWSNRGLAMAANLASGGSATQRNIPAPLIDDARRYVYEAAIHTPLVQLNYDGPSDIYLKLECLQPIGSFKIRGAYNAVRLLPEEQRKRGVWTVSAGNAAQGVALAARKAGVPCKVLVMDTAPVAKLDAARRLGAEIVKASC